jgi:hypothetical protein
MNSIHRIAGASGLALLLLLVAAPAWACGGTCTTDAGWSGPVVIVALGWFAYQLLTSSG